MTYKGHHKHLVRWSIIMSQSPLCSAHRRCASVCCVSDNQSDHSRCQRPHQNCCNHTKLAHQNRLLKLFIGKLCDESGNQLGYLVHLDRTLMTVNDNSIVSFNFSKISSNVFILNSFVSRDLPYYSMKTARCRIFEKISLFLFFRKMLN